MKTSEDSLEKIHESVPIKAFDLRKERSESRETSLCQTSSESVNTLDKHMEQLTVTINLKDNKSENRLIMADEGTNSNLPRGLDENTLAGIKNNRRNVQRTMSNSSSTYMNENSGGFDKSRLNFNTRTSESGYGGSVPNTPTNYFKNIEISSSCDLSCLFCQRFATT